MTKVMITQQRTLLLNFIIVSIITLSLYKARVPEKVKIKKPVMFSIYGGGFQLSNGSSKSHGPEYLLEGDVVYVSFNYRLGAFGFLSLENEDVPGNAGLKDQLLALRWVQENIQFFGGDPNNITIFGISAGGGSCEYMMVSPSAKGLFHKVIFQSGCLTSCTLQREPRKNALALAKLLGCSDDDPAQVLTFLQSVPADDIISATAILAKDQAYKKSMRLVFMPCVEGTKSNSSLPADPCQLIKEGNFHQVPVIIGGVVNEGTVALIDFLSNEDPFEEYNKNPGMFVPNSLGLEPGSEEENELGKQVQEFYSKGKPFGWSNVLDLLEYYGDVNFTFGKVQIGRLLSKYSSCPVYCYLFTNHTNCTSLRGPKMLPEEVRSGLTSSGTCHTDDGCYIYSKTTAVTSELTDLTKESIRRHVKAWTTFALTGNPNCEELGVTWNNSSESNPCYMDIGTSWNMREGIPFSDRITFWDNVLAKYFSRSTL